MRLRGDHHQPQLLRCRFYRQGIQTGSGFEECGEASFGKSIQAVICRVKIIISHDVDHLYPSDHWNDLIFPKLWIRSTLELVRGKINLQTWGYRLISIFQKRLNRIPEVAQFDQENGIPSEFFFGMDNALGLSYKQQKAKYWIEFLDQKGFGVGVHGINFVDYEKIKNEFNDFKKISGIDSFGIRMHYVRSNESTLKNLSKTGYHFDTTDFNKEKVDLKSPYKIASMWEFPLHIMDNYIMAKGLNAAQEQTIESLTMADKLKLPYFTILFHDYLFNSKTYPKYKEWYIWLICYLKSENYLFISYKEAITELDNLKSNPQ